MQYIVQMSHSTLTESSLQLKLQLVPSIWKKYYLSLSARTRKTRVQPAYKERNKGNCYEAQPRMLCCRRAAFWGVGIKEMVRFVRILPALQPGSLVTVAAVVSMSAAAHVENEAKLRWGLSLEAHFDETIKTCLPS